MRNFIRSIVMLAIVVLGACSGDGSSLTETQRPTSGLHFIRLSASAPPLQSTVVSFYAVKGQDREVRVKLSDGSDFLRFRVFSNSLDTRPDGTPIAQGDSILITITVPDPTVYAANFQPAGLKFVSPARLQFEFADCDKDLNGDGVVNAADSALILQMSTWRQETASAPWVKIGSTVETNINEVQSDIAGFSGYALAY